MTSDRPSLQKLWANQPTEGFAMSIAEVRKQADLFHRRTKLRNRVEYLSSFLVVVIFGLYAWYLPGLLTKLGSVLVAAGTLFVSWQLHRRIGVTDVPELSSDASCIAYYRAELERNRRALQSIWLWYLLPFVPGLVMTLYGMYRHSPSAHLLVLAVAGICAAFFVLVWALNRWAAARLQKKIDQLGEYRGD